MSTTTPLMGLTVTQVNDPTPGYVSAIAASLALLDAHDHTSGKGAQVPTAGLNINAPLPFNGYSATGLRSAQLQALGAALSATLDNNSVFSVLGDLYFLDGSNRLVRLTSGGNMAASGGFGGDYTTNNASASYSASTHQYTFRDEFGVLATLNVGALLTGTFDSNFGGVTPAIGSAGVSVLPGNTATNSVMLSVQGDIAAQGGFVHSAFATYQTMTASQTNQTMRGLNGISGGGGNAIGYWVAPRQGSIVGVSWYYSTNQTAGSLTFTVYKNGVATAATLGPVTSGQGAYASIAKDTVNFATNDILDVRFTTNGAFAPVSQDGVAYLHVEY